jgi:hypothetical protein
MQCGFCNELNVAGSIVEDHFPIRRMNVFFHY